MPPRCTMTRLGLADAFSACFPQLVHQPSTPILKPMNRCVGVPKNRLADMRNIN